MSSVPDVDDELESLRRENACLRTLLRLTDTEAAPALGSQARGREFFTALFAARTDVYALSCENARLRKSGWMPAVEGGWCNGTVRPV